MLMTFCKMHFDRSVIYYEEVTDIIFCWLRGGMAFGRAEILASPTSLRQRQITPQDDGGDTVAARRRAAVKTGLPRRSVRPSVALNFT